MRRIDVGDVKVMTMPAPRADLQKTFATRAAAAWSLKTARCTSLAELDALFASLQYRAFRGEL